MAASLFSINLTLPLVLVLFLLFVQLFKACFFDPIMDIKEKRRLTLEKLNADIDYGSKNTFALEDRLKQEELSTQRLIQEAYQKHVTKAQLVSTESIQERKQVLASELDSHVEQETARIDAMHDALTSQTADLVDQITKKVLPTHV